MNFDSRTGKASFISATIFFGGSLIFQLILIWYLYPSPSDFDPIETVTGKYTYESSHSQSNGRSFIASHEIFCTANFVDSRSPCRYSYLEGKIVTAKIARYRTLFGGGEIVVRATTSDGVVPIEYSGKQLVSQWCSLSVFRAVLQAAVMVVIFLGIRKYRFLKQDQKNSS